MPTLSVTELSASCRRDYLAAVLACLPQEPLLQVYHAECLRAEVQVSERVKCEQG